MFINLRRDRYVDIDCLQLISWVSVNILDYNKPYSIECELFIGTLITQVARLVVTVTLFFFQECCQPMTRRNTK